MPNFLGPSASRGAKSPTIASITRQEPRWTLKDEVYETRRDLEIISRHFQTLSKEVGESVIESTRKLDEINLRQEHFDKENLELKEWTSKQCHDYFETLQKDIKTQLLNVEERSLQLAETQNLALQKANSEASALRDEVDSRKMKFMFRVVARALRARFWAWKLDLMSILARDNFRFAG